MRFCQIWLLEFVFLFVFEYGAILGWLDGLSSIERIAASIWRFSDGYDTLDCIYVTLRGIGIVGRYQLYHYSTEHANKRYEPLAHANDHLGIFCYRDFGRIVFPGIVLWFIAVNVRP